LTFNVDYKKRAEYVQAVLGRYGINDGLLLDLACGTGSMAVEFSKMGYEVIATDASADMLMEAQNKAYDNEQSIMFLCQRMEETDLYGTVRAVVCALDSINHLPDASAMAQTFQVLKNFVDDGGIMVFDVNTVYKHQKILGNNTFVYDEKNVFCVWQNNLYDDGVTVGINLDFFVKDDKNKYNRFTESFKEIAFTDEEITTAVENAGFKVVKRYAEFSCSKPEEDTQRAYYVIRREY
jgi:ubiquinone/menaquinone biosynthesis C-methylase UbiE